MPDIRYVCLSDLHLGQDDGLLTNLADDLSGSDVSRPSRTLEALVDGLRDLIGKNENQSIKPTLVLNGDILELALTTMNKAAMAFERFVELALPEDEAKRLFDHIIYVPGNHDHHIWELARETLYVQYMERRDVGDELEAPWHTSRMFVDMAKQPLIGFFLSRLINRHKHLRDFQVEIAYPNLGIYDEQQSRAVLFHHGHFIEDLYKLMSTVATMLFPKEEMPTEIWDIEAENFAWIDFFWSAMGRSGRVGPLVQKAYNSLGYEKARDKLISNLATSLSKKVDIPFIPFDKPEAAIIRALLKHVVDKAADQERGRGENKPLSDDSVVGLSSYLSGPVMGQLLNELGAMPDLVTFVFGHTHKPYQDVMSVPVGDGDKNVPVYNTGGWVVENVAPSPLHGASVLFIDEELNTAALKLYKENDFQLEVTDASVDASVNHFKDHLGRLVTGSSIWDDFSRTVQAELRKHQGYLDSRLKF